MMIGYKKEEGSVRADLQQGIGKARHPVRIESKLKKSKSTTGFEPGLSRQNAVALPIVPPTPQPFHSPILKLNGRLNFAANLGLRFYFRFFQVIHSQKGSFLKRYYIWRFKRSLYLTDSPSGYL